MRITGNSVLVVAIGVLLSSASIAQAQNEPAANVLSLSPAEGDYVQRSPLCCQAEGSFTLSTTSSWISVYVRIRLRVTTPGGTVHQSMVESNLLNGQTIQLSTHFDLTLNQVSETGLWTAEAICEYRDPLTGDWVEIDYHPHFFTVSPSGGG